MKISNQYRTHLRLALIVNDFIELLSDGQMPIVYSGTTYSGTRILGLLADRAYDEDIRIHLALSAEEYEGYLNQKYSYLDLIKLQKEIFIIIDKFDSTVVVECYLVDYRKIDNDILPLEGSFLPSGNDSEKTLKVLKS